MKIVTEEDLLKAIVKYRASHLRQITANFEGELKEYQTEQLGLDIIEALCERIMQLEIRVQNLSQSI
jgi:hypothetical protein